MLGMTPRDFVGCGLGEIMAPDDVSGFEAGLVTIGAGQTFVRERCLRRNDGSESVVEISAKRLSDGRIQGIICDVTARRRAEEAMREREERLRILATAPFEGIIVVEHGRIIDLNDQYAQMFRGHRSAFIGQEVVRFVAPEFRPMVAERIRLGSEEAYEHQGLRCDGSVFDVEVRGKEATWKGSRVRVTAIRDITERKRAETALRESEAFRMRVFEGSRIPMVVMDAESLQCVDCNGAAVQIYQFPSREAMLGKTPAAISPSLQCDGSPSEAKARFYVEKALAEGSVVFEWQHRYPDGEVWDAEVHLMQFVSGRKQFLQLTIQDVSERKRAASALRESELRFQALFENMMEGFAYCRMVYDEKGRPSDFVYIDVNYAFEKLTGLKDVVGKPVSEVIPGIKEASPELFESYGRVAATGLPERFEFHFKSQNQWLSISVYSPGKGFFVAVFEDITARRRMEDRIKQLGHLRQKLLGTGSLGARLQMITDGVVAMLEGGIARVWTVQKGDLCTRGCPHAQITEGPGACLDRTRCLHLMAGSGRDFEVGDSQRRVPLVNGKIGRGVNGVNGGLATNGLSDDPTGIDRAWAEALGLAACSRRQLVAGNREPVGELVFFSTKPLLPDEENLLGEIGSTASLVILTVQAEQQRHELETQLQQAQKLESLGLLAGGIAHDFNNLLTAILGHANLALMELAPESPARDSLREIDNAASRAADLCRQMLAYAGKGRFVVEPINLSRLIGEVAHLLHVSISKKVLLRCQLAEGLPAIDADAAQLRQVAMNLVINAAEAIGDAEGVIAISTGVMECNEDYLRTGQMTEPPPPGSYVYLEVTDTGCGMDAETRDKIFDPFFTTKFTGRGLGLAAVLGIVRSHRGTLRVESEQGRGTTFRVLLPASAKAVALAESRGNFPLWRGKGTVLLVDDEEPIRNVTGRMLERLGFAVLRAGNGIEALDLFIAHAPEVVCVLLDLAMPRMDGEETFRELRRIQPGVRVVLASGFSDQEITQRFRGALPVGFIEKPYRIDSLATKLREALEPQ